MGSFNEEIGGGDIGVAAPAPSLEGRTSGREVTQRVEDNPGHKQLLPLVGMGKGYRADSSSAWISSGLARRTLLRTLPF